MKTTSLALAAVLLAGSFAAPALANDDNDNSFNGNWYVTQLQQKGVDAVAAYEGAPGEVRAVVQLADGQQVFQYFDDSTLKQIGGAATTSAAPTAHQTRVLTKLDTGANRAPVIPDAVSVDDFFGQDE